MSIALPNVYLDRPIGFIYFSYFTVVSLTTVGYGDITPATDNARLINAVVMTPIRIFLLVLFLGTAYELTVLRLRLREERQMKELHDRLSQHVIVCGYGVKGGPSSTSCLRTGRLPIRSSPSTSVKPPSPLRSQQGLVALQGDASSEELLRAANVEDASTVLVAPNPDDASVLISLTVRSLAPRGASGRRRARGGERQAGSTSGPYGDPRIAREGTNRSIETMVFGLSTTWT